MTKPSDGPEYTITIDLDGLIRRNIELENEVRELHKKIAEMHFRMPDNSRPKS